MDKNKIKYLVMDVDGTLTDGKIYMGANGEIFKAFDIKDGLGIHDIAIKNGIIPVIITGRKSEIVANRAKELGIEKVFQGISDKKSILLSLTDDLSSIAYIGDDDNDLQCMEIIKGFGIIGCPKDASKRVIAIADYISDYRGGNGAVRDFIEFLCFKK